MESSSCCLEPISNSSYYIHDLPLRRIIWARHLKPSQRTPGWNRIRIVFGMHDNICLTRFINRKHKTAYAKTTYAKVHSLSYLYKSSLPSLVAKYARRSFSISVLAKCCSTWKRKRRGEAPRTSSTPYIMWRREQDEKQYKTMERSYILCL